MSLKYDRHPPPMVGTQSVSASENGRQASSSHSNRAALSRKVDVRLPGKGNANSHGARPVHLIITMIKWIRTSRLSRKNSLSGCTERDLAWGGWASVSSPSHNGGSKKEPPLIVIIRNSGIPRSG